MVPSAIAARMRLVEEMLLEYGIAVSYQTKYGADRARRAVMPDVEHCSHKELINRAGISHIGFANRNE